LPRNVHAAHRLPVSPAAPTGAADTCCGQYTAPRWRTARVCRGCY